MIARSQLVARLNAADPVLYLLLTVLLNRLRRGQLRIDPEDSVSATVAPAAVIERIRLENELKAGLAAGECGCCYNRLLI